MKKIGLLLVLLSLLIAACSSGGAEGVDSEGNEEQMAATELPPTVSRWRMPRWGLRIRSSQARMTPCSLASGIGSMATLPTPR